MSYPLAERLRRQRILIFQHFAGAATGGKAGARIFVSERELAAFRSVRQEFGQRALEDLQLRWLIVGNGFPV